MYNSKCVITPHKEAKIVPLLCSMCVSVNPQGNIKGGAKPLTFAR